jgi:hypothetical protein
MNNCVIGHDMRCVECGVVATARNVLRPCPFVVRPGLGDIVAAGLSAVGITKERASAAAKLVGIEDCGCSKRQQQLNELGHRVGIGSPPESPSA